MMGMGLGLGVGGCGGRGGEVGGWRWDYGLAGFSGCCGFGVSVEGEDGRMGRMGGWVSWCMSVGVGVWMCGWMEGGGCGFL